MTSVATGGCLCGAIRYRIDAEPTDFAWCHCRMCQKASGAPSVAWTMVPSRAFRWTAGAPARYPSSTKGVRWFCPACGSPMLFETPQRTDIYDINTATLDEPGRFAPTYNVYADTRLSWCEAGGTLPNREDD